MTGKVVNLRQVRKTKTRDEKRAAADTNAVRHGLSKTERDAQLDEKNRARRLLDGHEVEDDSGDAE
jgi:hypothetical protein